MCGRYVIKNPVTKTSKLVKSAIQVEDNENYNAHPYQKLPVIKKYKNGNTLEALKWGLIPGWAKDKDFKALINARLETIDEKDDLQSIKGIGPFIAEKLYALGIYTFEQVGNMTPKIEEEVNIAIEFFPGRVKRDEWAKQAKQLHKDKK